MPASVGRIVHYVSFGTSGGEYPSTCRAAVVTEVPADVADPQIIGLAVFNPTGVFFNPTIPHDEFTRAGGTWHWPERHEQHEPRERLQG